MAKLLKGSDFPRCAQCSQFGPDVLERAADTTPAINGKKPGISWTGGLAICPCEKVFYCNAECQTKHWPEHKPECNHGRSSKIPITACTNCDKVSDQNMWCPCGTTLYCSVGCQRAHWAAGHFEVCRPLQDRSEVAEVRQRLAREGKERVEAQRANAGQ